MYGMCSSCMNPVSKPALACPSCGSKRVVVLHGSVPMQEPRPEPPPKLYVKKSHHKKPVKKALEPPPVRRAVKLDVAAAEIERRAARTAKVEATPVVAEPPPPPPPPKVVATPRPARPAKLIVTVPPPRVGRSMLGDLMERFGEMFPEFLVRDGDLLTVPLIEFAGWIPGYWQKGGRA